MRKGILYLITGTLFLISCASVNKEIVSKSDTEKKEEVSSPAVEPVTAVNVSPADLKERISCFEKGRKKCKHPGPEDQFIRKKILFKDSVTILIQGYPV